ncbi:HNH endonuclease [Rhodococcus oryzae]|uniref:HNH endonuclease n=1 Tax=Rhodococcus oryzae TaxID=2571143 RepID=A0ABY2REJ6_9NOCA|nr:HNH endonuclease signature motif containing protein [Rhodococcus oryzae]TJZ74401.1 HNH endonuclease [Rhodococcus oryzae]
MTVFVGLGDLANATRDAGDEPEELPPATKPSSSFIRRGPAWMPWLGPIGLRLAVTLSCDASITPIVMDDDGNPLDVGRTTRTIPRRLRRALDARDCGCAFPGCGRPAAWTDGHHIHHWPHGGETKLSNLVLLCRFHHTLIHKGDWQVHIGDDQHPPPRTPSRGGPPGSFPRTGSTTNENPSPPTTEVSSHSPADPPTQTTNTAPDHDPHKEAAIRAVCVTDRYRRSGDVE